MQIFKSNEFFCGLSIPDPGTIEPIEKKLPKEIAGVDGVDFMKVLILRFFFQDKFSIFAIFFRNVWTKIRPNVTLVNNC